jgi:hypothetical protein
MRWYEIIESKEWDLKGYWITDKGERMDVDHNRGSHHADIVFDQFADYVDWDDVFAMHDTPQDYEIAKDDDFARDTVLDAAFDNGWIRVSTSRSGSSIDIVFRKSQVTKISLNVLKREIKNDYFKHYNVDVGGNSMMSFDTQEKLFRYLNELTL